MSAFGIWKFTVVICAILGIGYSQTLDGTCPDKSYCVTVPEGCGKGACKAVVTVVKKGDTFSFDAKLDAADKGYIGVGLSTDQEMGDNDFIVACFDGTKTGTFNAASKAGITPITPVPSNVVDLAPTLDNGVLQCKFDLKFPLTVADTPIDFKMGGPHHVLLAHGVLDADGKPQQHGGKPLGRTAGDKNIWLDATFVNTNNKNGTDTTTKAGGGGDESTTAIPPDSSNYLTIAWFLLILAFAHITFVAYRHI